MDKEWTLHGNEPTVVVIVWPEIKNKIKELDAEQQFKEYARVLDLLSDGIKRETCKVIEVPTGFQLHDFEYYGEIKSCRNIVRDYLEVTEEVLDLMDECLSQ